MATALLPVEAENEVRRVRFTRSKVNYLLEKGCFDGLRFELIDGDLIDKMGQKPPHAVTVQLVSDVLQRFFARRIRTQAPMDVALPDRDLNEPEPDLVVVTGEVRDYLQHHPRGDETVLVVEVADTSLRQDSIRKRDLYARAGVPEYWVLNVPARQLIVHRDLHNARYSRIIALADDTTVSVPGHPDSAIPVAQLLP